MRIVKAVVCRLLVIAMTVMAGGLLSATLARDLPVLTNICLIVIAFTVLANSGADLLAHERGTSQ